MRAQILPGLVAVALLSAACGGPTPTRPPHTVDPVPPAVATPAFGTAPPSESPSPPSVPGAPVIGWQRIGDGPPGGQLLDWYFSEGYLAIGGATSPDDENLAAWFSRDGSTWSATPLSSTITPCAGWEPRASANAVTGWAAGGGAVILGTEFVQDAERCEAERVVAWATSDGRTWSTSSAFGDGEQQGSPIRVWAAGDRWEAAIQERDGLLSVWASSGGERWGRVGVLSESELDSIGPVTVRGADERRVAAIRHGESPSDSLIESRDGRTWTALDGPPLAVAGAESWVQHILAPDGPVQLWIVVVASEGDTFESVVWTSGDLTDWASSRFPMPAVSSINHTPWGLIALGMVPCRDTGGTCETVKQYLLSRDGLSWEPLTAEVGPLTFIEGPSGVVGIGDGSAYTLVPYTSDQVFLLAGIREDARHSCSPREELPAGATAGVECVPATGPASRIGAYLFPSEQVLLATYFARLADAGVTPDSGECPRTRGDSAYTPGDDLAPGPHRIGCFINEFGIANHRITYPGSLVYVGVLGRDGSLASLFEWVWAGNEDAAGPPTVWNHERATTGS